MSLPEPYPVLEEILVSIGEAGLRLSSIEASEGAAGNISVYIGWPIEVHRLFPLAEKIDLPLPAPALRGKVVLVTGSGRRLRDLHRDPATNLGAVLIAEDGATGTLYTSPRRLFERVTSEFNTHLAVHNDQVGGTGTNFHALIHAQPPYLVYLSHVSHVPEYRDTATINKRLMRWEPETILQLPKGIGVLSYILPGSPALMDANVVGLREHSVTLWSKHGVMARSDISVTRAADRIEHIETAARYEYLDLIAGGRGEGLTEDELREVVRAFNVNTTLVDPDAPDFLNPPDMVAAIQAYCLRTGQPEPPSVGEIVRCCLESLALKYRQVLTSLERLAGRRLGTIRIVGGAARVTCCASLQPMLARGLSWRAPSRPPRWATSWSRRSLPVTCPIFRRVGPPSGGRSI